VIVGVHDPHGAGALAGRVAAALGRDAVAGEVFVSGPLAVAGAETPQRCGSVIVLWSGQLHDAAQTSQTVALEPDTPPALIVATGYAQHGGMSFLRALRGAYQLVLWDEARAEVLVTADHLSARTIFYRSDGARTCFAGELTPLRRALAQDPGPDPEIVPRWITDRSLPDGLTLFRGVRRLRCGAALRMTRGGCRSHPVWQPNYRPQPDLSVQDAGAQIREAVRSAVQRRLSTDGTTGALLSGGFDSAMIAGTAVPLLAEHDQVLPAYSTIFPGEPWDESADVRLLTRIHHHLPATELRVTGGTVLTALRFQEAWGVPQPAPGSILDTPLLARARSDGLRVMLDGQGGDELFAASPYLLTDYVLSGQLAAAWRLAHQFPGTGSRLARWQVQALARHIVVMGGLPHRAHGQRTPGRKSAYATLAWLHPRGRAIAEAFDDPWAWKRRAGAGPRWWAHLAHLLVDARELSGLQDYLRRRGMMLGIDSRQPLLLDVDLVELMLSLPPQYAMSPRYDRALARDAMRGIVPEAIRVPTRKSNYGEFMRRTLSGPDFAELERILVQPDAEIGAFVDRTRMRDTFLIARPRVDALAWSDWAHRIWALATTELWLREIALGDGFAAWSSDLSLSPPRVEVLRAGDPQQRSG
jgi:asparagine synthase (glutamine-hydrolysing)